MNKQNMIRCEACGKELPSDNAFCTSCGAVIARQDPAGSSTQENSGISGPADSLVWERKIPLITNPYLVLQCIFIPLGIGLFLGLIFWLITGAPDMLTMFLLIGVAMAVIFLVVMLVLQLATGGGLMTMFFIGSEGVAHKAGSTTQGLDRAATAGAVIAGSLSGTGAGLIAMSQECNTLEWKDVRYVSVYKSVRSVVFRSKYLMSPVVLYCTEENFSAVLAMIRRYAPPSVARKI